MSGKTAIWQKEEPPGAWADDRAQDPFLNLQQGAQGESIFFREWLAGNRCDNQLAISAVCNSHCIFCSNHLNPFPITKGVFRDIEDTKLQLSVMKSHGDPIRMSDSLPGRLAEGEAFLHPRFFEILTLVRRKFFSNPLCFTTNASMLDRPFLKELSRYRPIEVTVSMHSADPELWGRIFGKTRTEGAKAIQALALIKRYHLDLVGSIVSLPAICGWEDIERSYAFLVSQGARSMMLWWPGYTVCTPPDVRRDMGCTLEEFLQFAGRMKALYQKPLSVLPDTVAPVSWPIRRIMSHTLRGNIKNGAGPFQGILWLTSEAAYPQLKKAVAKNAGSFGNRHYLFPVKNNTYGGNIIVAGLLMVDDFLLSGKEALRRWEDIDLVLIPRTPFDSLYKDLRQTPAYRLADELQKPVWIINDDGSFDPLLGDRMIHSLVLQGSDSDLSGLGRTMRIFNQAWQGPSHVEASLDLIDSYPLQTSRGGWGRDQMRDRMVHGKMESAGESKPIGQGFHILDDDHAVCMEKWGTQEEAVTLNRWTFLIKRDSQWKIQEIRYGQEDPLSSGNGGP